MTQLSLNQGESWDEILRFCDAHLMFLGVKSGRALFLTCWQKSYYVAFVKISFVFVHCMSVYDKWYDL